MLPELGQIALILALCMAILQVLLSWWGCATHHVLWMRVGRSAAVGQWFFVLLAFLMLILCFLNTDFSVLYVTQHANSLLPWYYRFSAVWGGHEGSVLLWAFVLSCWTLAVVYRSVAVPEKFLAHVTAILGIVSCGFLLFIIFTSNPFLRQLPALLEGRDLNPLLQDIGLIIHPPILYMGYVGLAVSFAGALACLITGKMDTLILRWMRPWILWSWSFLTLGIVLGSWWAYYELGWGGWWFWDPVENASFMPWLVSTALLHSAMLTEKRQIFHAWTILLAIFAFALSLLGTFLVRSGVLTSVHAFANDPERGVFVLVFMAIVIGCALVLYAWRAPKLIDKNASGFALISRESVLLINNLLLMSAAAMVLLGTLYPLLADALNLGKISVGPPYFSLLFTIIMAPIFALVPLGIWLRWQRDHGARLVRPAIFSLSSALIVSLLCLLIWQYVSWQGLVAVFIGVWIFSSHILWFVSMFSRTATGRGNLSAGQLGMLCAHLGLSVFVVGVLITESMHVEKDVRMQPGDHVVVSSYQIKFLTVQRIDGPNYQADQGLFEISKNGKKIAQLTPSKRYYASGGNVMTEAGIDPGITRDVYIALGEQIDKEQQAWAVRVHVKPFIRWIWLGGLMMALGGLLAACDRRYQPHHLTITQVS